MARILIALFALATLFHPDDTLVWGTGAVTLLALIWGIRRHRRIAPPKEAPVLEPGAATPPEQLAAVIAEARRDIG